MSSKNWIVLFHSTVLVLVVVLCLEIGDLSLRALPLIALAWLLYVPIISRLNTGTLDIFEPIVFVNLSLGLMFVVRPLCDLATRETVHLGISVMPQFDYTLAVALVGVFAFQIGYHSRVTLDAFRSYVWMLPRPSREFRPDKAGQFGILVAVIGLGLFGMFIMQSGGVATLVALTSGRGFSDDAFFLSSNGYFYQGILALIPASALLFAAGLTTKRIAWLMGSAIPLAIFCGFYLGRGDRSNLLPALSIPMFWYMFRRRRPGTVPLILFGAL